MLSKWIVFFLSGNWLQIIVPISFKHVLYSFLLLAEYNDIVVLLLSKD